MDAEQYLWETKRQAVVAHRHPVGAGQCEFEPAAQCKTLDGSDRRAGQGLEPVDDRLPRLGQPFGLFDAFQGSKFIDVRSGDEAAAFT